MTQFSLTLIEIQTCSFLRMANRPKALNPISTPSQQPPTLRYQAPRREPLSLILVSIHTLIGCPLAACAGESLCASVCVCVCVCVCCSSRHKPVVPAHLDYHFVSRFENIKRFTKTQMLRIKNWTQTHIHSLPIATACGKIVVRYYAKEDLKSVWRIALIWDIVVRTLWSVWFVTFLRLNFCQSRCCRYIFEIVDYMFDGVCAQWCLSITRLVCPHGKSRDRSRGKRHQSGLRDRKKYEMHTL